MPEPAPSSTLERLRARSSSPFPPEPPRRHLLVSALFRLAQRRRDALVTPHLFGGSDREKVLYEYERADEWWPFFAGAAGPDVLSGADVLDVGCGYGGKDISYAERYGVRSITGFDLPGFWDPEAAGAFAAERGVGELCRFTSGYAEEMPFEDASFDVVLIEDVLEHVRRPDRVLAESARALRAGGTLLAKFPSVRMLAAHHLDRAITWPGIHLVLPLRWWAAGLNHELASGTSNADFEPFDEIVSTPYHPAVTRNLNGLGFSSFRELVRDNGFEVRHLEIVPMTIRPLSWWRRLALGTYRALCRVPQLRERLGVTIVFVGINRASSAPAPSA